MQENTETIRAIFQAQRQAVRSELSLPYAKRRENLLKLQKLIRQRETDINQALFKDLHKSPAETYLTETGVVLSEIRFALKHLRSWIRKKRVPTPIYLMPSASYILPQALGTVLIISPWNYPFQLALSPLLGAVAAGNRVLLNPSPQSPHTASLLQSLINDNFPESEIHCFDGEISTTDTLLKLKPDYLFFTGSPATARGIMSQVSSNLIPATLELGGKSPVIVDRDADCETAAKRIAFGKFVNCGQTCVAPDYLFIHRSLKEAFIKSFRRFVEKEYGQNPLESPFYGRIINKHHFRRAKKLLEGQNIIFGGELREEENYIAPTLVELQSLDNSLMQEEIFAPLLPMIVFDEINEPVDYILSQERPLALYYFGTENRNIIDRLPFGGGCINDTLMHIVSPYMPFGGVGNSGMGAYHGKASFDTFTHYKSILQSPRRFDFAFKYPPYTDTVLRIFKRLLR